VGSIIVEILHRVEGGGVEQWLEPRNIYLCLRLSTISLNSTLSLLALILLTLLQDLSYFYWLLQICF